MVSPPDRSARYPVEGAYALRPSLATHGGLTRRPDGQTLWYCRRTERGPASLRVWMEGTELCGIAWGPGAEAALEALPAQAGLLDQSWAWRCEDPRLELLFQRAPGRRLGRTGRVLDALVPTVLGQLITTVEAAQAWRGLCWDLGEAAPGPVPLRLPPSVEALQATPYYEVRRHGISEKMWSAIQRSCALAPRLEGLVGDLPALDAALLSIPGIGPWTSAHVRREAAGDPDAVPVGDYHLKNYVCYALAGEPRGDDARMMELLAPFAGQRGRVVELIMSAGPAAPKYGPRSPLRDPSVW